MLAGGEVSEDKDDDDKPAPVAESPKQGDGADPGSAELDVGNKEVVLEPAETAASAEDITGD